MKKMNSFSQLLSDDMRLNPGPAYQQTSQCLNKWNVFRNRSLQFVRLILIVCYQKLRNFGILQNLLMIPF